MKKIKINEQWCLGCHLCEYYCAYANSGIDDIVEALKGVKINPRLIVEGDNGGSFAFPCRHCKKPLCVMSCITGALSVVDGVVCIDKEKCVGCYTCIVSCPYGAIMPGDQGTVQKCELCLSNKMGKPACVQACPNKGLVFEEEKSE